MACVHRFRSVLFSMVVFLSHFMDLGHGLELEIVPERFVWGGDETVEMSCVLSARDLMAKEVLLMKLGKVGDLALAMVHPGNKLTIGTQDGMDRRVKAVGRIESDLKQSFLNVTLTDMEVADSGQYRCVVDYVKMDGELVEGQDSNHLFVEDPKLMKIKSTFKNLAKEMDKQEKKIRNIYDEKIAKLNSKLTTLDEQIHQHDKKIQVLQKDDHHVAFSVNNEEQLLWLKSGDVIKFPTVIMEIGGGYDKTTGVFTAPVGGLYVFSLSLYVACPKCSVKVELMHNKSPFDAILSGDMDAPEQTSTSTVVLLNTGDTVKAYVKEATIEAFLIHGKFCVFTGYRIGSKS